MLVAGAVYSIVSSESHAVDSAWVSFADSACRSNKD